LFLCDDIDRLEIAVENPLRIFSCLKCIVTGCSGMFVRNCSYQTSDEFFVVMCCGEGRRVLLTAF
jgi:hypothetical protein